MGLVTCGIAVLLCNAQALVSAVEGHAGLHYLNLYDTKVDGELRGIECWRGYYVMLAQRM